MAWPLLITNVLQKITIKGNNNKIELDNECTKDTVIFFDEKNNICIKK
jgi:hypothetical protein